MFISILSMALWALHATGISPVGQEQRFEPNNGGPLIYPTGFETSQVWAFKASIRVLGGILTITQDVKNAVGNVGEFGVYYSRTMRVVCVELVWMCLQCVAIQHAG